MRRLFADSDEAPLHLFTLHERHGRLVGLEPRLGVAAACEGESIPRRASCPLVEPRRVAEARPFPPLAAIPTPPGAAPVVAPAPVSSSGPGCFGGGDANEGRGRGHEGRGGRQASGPLGAARQPGAEVTRTHCRALGLQRRVVNGSRLPGCPAHWL